MYTARIMESDEAYHVNIYNNGKHECTYDTQTALEAGGLVFVLLQTQDPDALANVLVD